MFLTFLVSWAFGHLFLPRSCFNKLLRVCIMFLPHYALCIMFLPHYFLCSILGFCFWCLRCEMPLCNKDLWLSHGYSRLPHGYSWLFHVPCMHNPGKLRATAAWTKYLTNWLWKLADKFLPPTSHSWIVWRWNYSYSPFKDTPQRLNNQSCWIRSSSLLPNTLCMGSLFLCLTPSVPLLASLALYSLIQQHILLNLFYYDCFNSRLCCLRDPG